MKNKCKTIVFTAIGIVCVALIICAYNLWFSRTYIAFVNYQPIALQGIAQANNNSFIRLFSIDEKEIDSRLSRYDIILVNGMGLRIDAKQREVLQRLADRGVPIFTSMATNPENNISNFTVDETALLTQWMASGGKANYRSMLAFLRKNIDGKIISTGLVAPVQQKLADYLYFPATDSNDEEIEFGNVADYESYLKEQKIYVEGGKKIVVTGQITDPSDLIKALMAEGKYNVYPVMSFTRLLDFVEQIGPDAIVNLAHGRLGDDMVAYLKEHNVLLFDPLTINDLAENWENDLLGMAGGFMSQSIVMPEIDGAIRTEVVFAQKKDKDGMLSAYAIPERLATFVETINKYFALQTKPNSEKKIAIVYFKGPGQAALIASGLDVVSSLYNVLLSLKAEGYDLSGLPASEKEFALDIQKRGVLFNAYAAGEAERFMTDGGEPQLVSAEQYTTWAENTLRKDKIDDVNNVFGPFPGTDNLLTTDNNELAFPCIRYGNIALLPQPMAGVGEDEFRIVHGTDQVPPHSYIAPYLWIQHGFNADALIHFGTHGSLEFTPRKQVALSNNDWPDRLVNYLPHFYVYTIDNVGEAMTAKRRSYAQIISYLTPPYHESNLRGAYGELEKALREYHANEGSNAQDVEKIARLTEELDLLRDLNIAKGKTLTEADIEQIENYSQELIAEKVSGTPYTMGLPYTEGDIRTSVFAMTTDPIAYSKYNLDRLLGRTNIDYEHNRLQFEDRYIADAKRVVTMLYSSSSAVSDNQILSFAGITQEDLERSREIIAAQNAPRGMLAMMMAMSRRDTTSTAKDDEKTSGMAEMMNMMTKKSLDIPQAKNNPVSKFMRYQMRKMLSKKDPSMMLKVAKKMGASDEALSKMSAALQSMMGTSDTKDSTAATTSASSDLYTREDIDKAEAIEQIETALRNVFSYKQLLLQSPTAELTSIKVALCGGYTAPSAGGDLIANPNTLPTGRNLYAINAEETPSADAWEKAVGLVNASLDEYKKSHNGEYPRKVSYTLWSGEFIQTGGATLAQALYMLGVEPIRDRYNRVEDLRLIPDEELQRPRIDVVVQTSGQLRDLASSRLSLITKAVRMASEAPGGDYENLVKAGIDESERYLVDKGISPKDARRLSMRRVFGGLNGGYGTGIQGYVERGDLWDDDNEVAEQYLYNMGSYYGDVDEWESHSKEAFQAALTRTDLVVQPRQSNSWGALSLDHVYEFMGGMNLAVRNVTGKDPEAYFSDYRNRNAYKSQDARAAIGVEARTKLLNKDYIEEAMKGGTTPTDGLSEMVRNAYGWNVMKPAAVDDGLWNDVYDVYIDDKLGLDIHSKMGSANPAAMMEMTATMMETARKGYWQASEEQLQRVAQVHTDFVKRYGLSGGNFEMANQKLQKFIAAHASAADRESYEQSITHMTQRQHDGSKAAVLMEKQTKDDGQQGKNTVLNGLIVTLCVVAAFIVIVVLLRRRRQRDDD